ncbi:MAG: FkbM family methyltransferase [Acidobacteriaceae bacterium]|jgi:FkbM family methyltransferase
MSSMQRALRMLRPQLKGVAEKLFPKTMYSRRFHSWEKVEPELPLLPALCRKDAVALDIGANEGFFAHHLLPLAKSVIAFEPLPQMLTRLRANYANKMQIHGVIISDHEGQGELRYPAGGYMSATIAESNSSALESGRLIETVVAPMKTLDSFALTNVGFVKIDVEGHEEAVLHGGLTTLKREKPNLMIEIEERHAPGSLARVSALLESIGYSGFYLGGKELRPIAQFEPQRDQVRQNGKVGKYINNFLFLPTERATAILESARQHLSAAQN